MGQLVWRQYAQTSVPLTSERPDVQQMGSMVLLNIYRPPKAGMASCCPACARLVPFTGSPVTLASCRLRSEGGLMTRLVGVTVCR
ncbi:hypothetical protein DPEC_G00286910 [Dallia pectoralis]|uniref:Uncharacterized protein n=1 Tax=Dallia pectoralis TaxID=75939 RepID=A0ACC2FKH8_DALPE|nr:hypothetical protein DPEC_G00286910 [Dallia pectoralis]